MFGHIQLLLFFPIVFQCNAYTRQSPQTTGPSTVGVVPQKYLDCVFSAQRQNGSGGFGKSYRNSNNRRGYGPVPSSNKPVYNPPDLHNLVTIEVQTYDDITHDGPRILYKLWVENTDTVPRSGQLAWFTPESRTGRLPDTPDYIFTVTAAANQGVQGCVILPTFSAQKHLTYQAF